MDSNALHEYLKELHEHLLSQHDARGLVILQKAKDLVRTQTLSDVTEGELMGFLRSIEETEGSGSADEWVSSSALRTHVGLVTRGMIEKEINRRSVRF
jgi:hypothetical protein